MLEQILQQLAVLKSWVEGVISKQKKIDDFPVQDDIVASSKIHVSNNGDSQSLTVEKIARKSLDYLPLSDSISSNSTVTVASSLAIKTVNDKVNINASDITNLETSKIAISDIVNNLTSTATNKTLSALQGKVLKQLIDNINTLLSSDDTTLDQIQEVVDFIKQNKEDLQNLAVANIAGLQDVLNSLTASVIAINTQLDTKVGKIIGKGLSSNDFTNYHKSKLTAIAPRAEVNVRSDWNATSGDALIKNKPIIPTQIYVDATLSSSSINAVQNRVINSALNTKENAFTKNTAFNKSFGTSANKVAQGNDSRIINGQTAFSWGNHDSVGYLTSLPTHTHSWDSITNKPDAFASSSHTHSWSQITGKPTRFSPSKHAHSWSQITGKPPAFTPTSHNHDSRYYTEAESNGRFLGKVAKAVDSDKLDGLHASSFARSNHNHDGLYEPEFTKNTAFNKSFGTSANKVAQGNDSRILNGETAYNEAITEASVTGTISKILTFTKRNRQTITASWTDISGGGGTSIVVDTAISRTSTNPVENRAIKATLDRKASKNYVDSAVISKENTFTKNTAFNKNFGTNSRTVAQGNDSRIINGQTAFNKKINSIGITGDANKILTLTREDGTTLTETFADIDTQSSDVFLNSLNFNIGNGNFTAVLNDNATASVNLDGRYTLLNHNHNSQYLGIRAKASDSNLLDGINSTGFLRTNINNVIAKNNPFLTLKDTIGVGNMAVAYLQMQDSDDTVMGYIGYGSTNNPDIQYVNNIGKHEFKGGRIETDSSITSKDVIIAGKGYRTNPVTSGNANNILTDYSSNTIAINSNSRGSDNFPGTFGQSLIVRGSTDNRTFMLYRTNGVTDDFYYSQYTGTAWVHNKILHANNFTDYTDSKYLRSDISDTMSGSLTATNFILASDERLKNNIKELALKPININWKSFNLYSDQDDYRVGVIAQELEVNHPEFVKTDPRGYKSVKYIDLLVSKVAELENENKKLKSILASLSERLTKLEQ